MSKKYTWNKGATFDYMTMIPGLGLIVYGIYKASHTTDTLSMIAFSLLALLGLILFPGFSVITINMDQRKATRFLNLLLFKIPVKIRDLSGYRQVVLALFRETQTMYYRSISATARTRSYDVFLEGEGQERFMIAETTDYEEAQRVLAEVSECTQLPADNRFEDMLESLQRNRRK